MQVAIKAISIGKGDKAITVGGETCYPFYQFEAKCPTNRKLPWKSGTWHPKSGRKRPWNLSRTWFRPGRMGQKMRGGIRRRNYRAATQKHGPQWQDASPADASATVKKVLGAIDVPLVVWGIANHEKDEAVLKQSPKTARMCRT
jgi:acetyl-CoA decarbonylase/synthase complex subunit delta